MPVDIPHKGGRTVGYRVSDGHSSVAYLPDHCPTALGPGPDGLGERHPAAVELARDVDLLIHDSHLRAEEVAAEGAFGHAAAEYAVALAEAAGARPGRALPSPARPDRSRSRGDGAAVLSTARCPSSAPQRVRRSPYEAAVRQADAIVVGSGTQRIGRRADASPGRSGGRRLRSRRRARGWLPHGRADPPWFPPRRLLDRAPAPARLAGVPRHRPRPAAASRCSRPMSRSPTHSTVAAPPAWAAASGDVAAHARDRRHRLRADLRPACARPRQDPPRLSRVDAHRARVSRGGRPVRSPGVDLGPPAVPALRHRRGSGAGGGYRRPRHAAAHGAALGCLPPPLHRAGPPLRLARSRRAAAPPSRTRWSASSKRSAAGSRPITW